MKKPNCRQRNLQMPTELCVRYERRIGLQPGEKPSKANVETINELMIDDLERSVRNIKLTSRDYLEIAKEEEEREAKYLAQLKK